MTRNKKIGAKISIGKLTDEEFADIYPEAWETFSYFDTRIKKAGRLHRGKFRRKSRRYAYEIHVEDLDLTGLQDCIRWCFSTAKQEHPTWHRIPINHLGTVLTVFNDWDILKKKGKSSSRSAMQDRIRNRVNRR